MKRLRTFLRSTGRYGPSPFLVGHYGGAGDLIGGFSRWVLLFRSCERFLKENHRVCAVWGGGQILGRSLHPLLLDPPLVTSVEEPGEMKPDLDPTKFAPLGVEVSVDPLPAVPMLLTADWIISSSSHLPILFPSTPTSTTTPHSVHGIIILPSSIPFPSAEDEIEEEKRDKPDSSLFVFGPKALDERLGTVTVLQVGTGTFACPEGYCTSLALLRGE